MKFVIQYTLEPATYKAAVARFLQTGGLPPAGVKMVGRWHGGGQGWIVAEASDANGIYEWIAQWSDLIRFPIATPVTEDQETAEILKRLNP